MSLGLGSVGAIYSAPWPVGVQACNTRCQDRFTDCLLRCDGRVDCEEQCRKHVQTCVARCRAKAKSPSNKGGTGGVPSDAGAGGSGGT